MQSLKEQFLPIWSTIARKTIINVMVVIYSILKLKKVSKPEATRIIAKYRFGTSSITKAGKPKPTMNDSNLLYLLSKYGTKTSTSIRKFF